MLKEHKSVYVDFIYVFLFFCIWKYNFNHLPEFFIWFCFRSTKHQWCQCLPIKAATLLSQVSRWMSHKK